MAQFSTQGGEEVLARSAWLSCEYSGERVQFIVCEGRGSVALTPLCTNTPGVSQERPTAKLGSLRSVLSHSESLESVLAFFFLACTKCIVLFKRLCGSYQHER